MQRGALTVTLPGNVTAWPEAGSITALGTSSATSRN
jgi:hypothetical protein